MPPAIHPPSPAPPADGSAPRTLIDQLLEEQRALFPVGRFAKRHDAGDLPELAPVYRDLIPLSKPGPGEQYAFEVNLDACTGCKACVAACHSLNGLDPKESWRDVGLAVGHDDSGNAWQQTITTACHHCGDPACANGCPVLAYEKDAETGIVRHLDDQCIGCSYCVMKCPYDVPKFNPDLGIVRKCDMCHDRLAEGEAPACVQACPTQAISIRVVSRSLPADPAELAFGGDRLVPGAHASSYTRPMTRYRSQREIPASVRAADERDLRPDHAHLPLVWMLVVTQIAGGIAVALGLGWSFIGETARAGLATAAALGMTVGLAGAMLHLGKPTKAWRAFLGWRKSWLSREIVVFGAAPPMAAGLAAALGLEGTPWFPSGLPLQAFALATAAAILAGIACSVMVYADAPRALWRLPRTTFRFLATVAIAAGGALALSGAVDPGLALLGTALAIKLGAELRFLRGVESDGWSDDIRSARVMAGPLGRLTRGRNATALLATVLSVIGLGAPQGGAFAPAVAACLLALVSELLERALFFSASTAPHMPRGAAH